MTHSTHPLTCTTQLVFGPPPPRGTSVVMDPRMFSQLQKEVVQKGGRPVNLLAPYMCTPMVHPTPTTHTTLGTQYLHLPTDLQHPDEL